MQVIQQLRRKPRSSDRGAAKFEVDFLGPMTKARIGLLSSNVEWKPMELAASLIGTIPLLVTLMTGLQAVSLIQCKRDLMSSNR